MFDRPLKPPSPSIIAEEEADREPPGDGAERDEMPLKAQGHQTRMAATAQVQHHASTRPSQGERPLIAETQAVA